MQQQKDKPTIAMLDIGEPMRLYKTIKGKKTDAEWVLDNYRLWLSKNRYSIWTIITYVKCIKKLLEGTTNNNPSLSSTDIEVFLYGKTNLYFSAIKNFLKFSYFLFNKKFIHINYPRVFTPERKIIQILTNEEINLIINALPNDYKFFTKFLHYCGLRISEIFRLKVSSLNWSYWINNKSKHGLITIKKTKGKKERQIPLDPNFMLEIFNHIKKRDGKVILDEFLFNFNFKLYSFRKMKSMRKEGIGEILDLSEKELLEYRKEIIWFKFITKSSIYFEKLFRKTSLEVIKKKAHPHILRASRATELLNSGLTLMQCRDFLGHTSVKTTELYLQTNIEQLTSAMEDIHNKK